jgi:predicted aldo/keto reductase-like oxidoreductase
MGMDFIADDALRRIEDSLASMDICRAGYFVCWNISDYSDFEAIMRKGGIYDGAAKAKRSGLIEHICFSSHASADNIIRIIASGAFEAVTISYSLLNSIHMDQVLDAAQKYNTGVVVMNPLGGGVIPQNREYFAFSRNERENSTPQAALRFIAAHKAVGITLTGSASVEEFEENLTAFTQDDTENSDDRIQRVNSRLKNLENFCSGCHYCDGCPVGIPIYEYMQSRNSLLFTPSIYYNRTELDLLRNIWLFKKLQNDFQIIPDTPHNPCIHCGKCESKCTQHLEIIDAIEDTYKRMEIAAFSLSARQNRLNSLLSDKGYKKVGFYPGGGYTSTCNKNFLNHLCDQNFEKVAFDSNPKLWGSKNGDMIIHSPDEILTIHPDCILICNFIYDDEIYNQIKHYQNYGIDILRLHKPDDVPWVM